jgi:hypothetical protein
MWKRLPLRDRGKENHVHISGPTLVNSTYDHEQLDHAADIGGPPYDSYDDGYDHQARPPVSRQNTDQSTLAPLDLYVPGFTPQTPRVRNVFVY